MTKGIKDVGKWVHYCPELENVQSFIVGSVLKYLACDTPLKRKLLKD